MRVNTSTCANTCVWRMRHKTCFILNDHKRQLQMTRFTNGHKYVMMTLSQLGGAVPLISDAVVVDSMLAILLLLWREKEGCGCCCCFLCCFVFVVVIFVVLFLLLSFFVCYFCWLFLLVIFVGFVVVFVALLLV